MKPKTTIHLSRPAAGIIATILLTGYLFVTPLEIIRISDFKHTGGMSSDISPIEQRFTDIKNYLPKNVHIGYLSQNNMDISIDHPAAAKKFSVAQYAVIPNLLVLNTSPEIVIGDFDDTKTAAATIQQHNLVITKDFHNGLYLLKHKQ